MCGACTVWGLRKIKEHMTSSELCYFALSNCLDTLYTNYLLGNATDLSIEIKLQNISRTVSLKKRNEVMDGFDLIEILREAQRDLAATLTSCGDQAMWNDIHPGHAGHTWDYMLLGGMGLWRCPTMTQMSWRSVWKRAWIEFWLLWSNHHMQRTWLEMDRLWIIWE